MEPISDRLTDGQASYEWKVAPAVSVESLSKRFPGRPPVQALNDVSFSLKAGEFFTLLGPSGCGKSTLLRLIAGFDRPDAGRILLDGQDVGETPAHRRSVNTIFQSYALFPHLSVAGNVAFGLEMLGWKRRQIDSRVTEMLNLVGLVGLGERSVSALSGGQAQRVAVARALAPQPKVLLLDEPLSALDYQLRKQMRGELKRLQRETGVTFLFVTHDQEEAFALSDRLAVMSEGRILQVGSPEQLYQQPVCRKVAEFVGDMNFLNVTVAATGETSNRLQLQDGAVELFALPGTQVQPGDTATVAIRPEHIRLSDHSDIHSISATVEGVQFTGPDLVVRVNLDGAHRLDMRLQAGTASSLSPGDVIGISIPSHAVKTLSK